MSMMSWYSSPNYREQCDVCGAFLSWRDIGSGRAIHRMISPDSDVSSEEWETLCPKHLKESGDVEA